MGMSLHMAARIQSRKVMLALMNTERQFPSVGLALLKVFFPGELSDEEHKFWATRRERQRTSRNAKTPWTATPPQTTPPVTIPSAARVAVSSKRNSPYDKPRV